MRVERRTREVEGVGPDAIPYADLVAEGVPTILKGVARGWPLVAAGLDSAEAAIAHLLGFYQGRPVTTYTGDPAINGRFFYDEGLTRFNFEAAREPLDAFLARVAANGAAGAPALYLGSTDLDQFLPGFRAANDLALDDPMFAAHPPIASIWIGNRTMAAAHHDMSNNIAVCVAGRRRFTLFPPEQVANLYPGPLEPTPGGQVVSLVDFRDPDLDRFPLAREAIEAGEVAEMEPGDMLFYPALWWHQVEALADFNILVNYWWNLAPAFMDTPQNTLLHAMLSLRDRPEQEKAAWRAMFDYYVFGPADRPAAHLPEPARGNLAPLDEMRARRLRAYLLNRLNR